MMYATRIGGTEKPNLELVRPAWMRLGLCQMFPDLSWFPERGEPTGPAKAVCGRCQVSNECLKFALEQGPSLQGIWGGTSPRQRRHLGKVV